MRLGINVPTRNPDGTPPTAEAVRQRERLATMNALTQGRFTLGVGAGSTRTDFDANRVDYEARFKILTEYLPIIRKLSNDEQVGSASLAPWARPGGGPRILIGAWANGPWVRRAAQEYDGWLASGHYTKGVKALADGIKRFRDAGGKRAVLANVRFNLSAPRQPLTEDGPFELLCGPQEASDRLHQAAELGFDDCLLAKQIGQTRDDVQQMRSIYPAKND